MKAKELTEHFGKYPDDLRVVVNGYEDGYNANERLEVKDGGTS